MNYLQSLFNRAPSASAEPLETASAQATAHTAHTADFAATTPKLSFLSLPPPLPETLPFKEIRAIRIEGNPRLAWPVISEVTLRGEVDNYQIDGEVDSLVGALNTIKKKTPYGDMRVVRLESLDQCYLILGKGLKSCKCENKAQILGFPKQDDLILALGKILEVELSTTSINAYVCNEQGDVHDPDKLGKKGSYFIALNPENDKHYVYFHSQEAYEERVNEVKDNKTQTETVAGFEYYEEEGTWYLDHLVRNETLEFPSEEELKAYITSKENLDFFAHKKPQTRLFHISDVTTEEKKTYWIWEKGIEFEDRDQLFVAIAQDKKKEEHICKWGLRFLHNDEMYYLATDSNGQTRSFSSLSALDNYVEAQKPSRIANLAQWTWNQLPSFRSAENASEHEVAIQEDEREENQASNLTPASSTEQNSALIFDLSAEEKLPNEAMAATAAITARAAIAGIAATASTAALQPPFPSFNPPSPLEKIQAAHSFKPANGAEKEKANERQEGKLAEENIAEANLAKAPPIVEEPPVIANPFMPIIEEGSFEIEEDTAEMTPEEPSLPAPTHQAKAKSGIKFLFWRICQAVQKIFNQAVSLIKAAFAGITSAIPLRLRRFRQRPSYESFFTFTEG